jgi:hypothetical protein
MTSTAFVKYVHTHAHDAAGERFVRSIRSAGTLFGQSIHAAQQLKAATTTNRQRAVVDRYLDTLRTS